MEDSHENSHADLAQRVAGGADYAVGTGPGKAKWKLLTGSELQKLFSGAVLDTSNPVQKWKGAVMYLADGTTYLVLMYAAGKGTQDSGKWRIVGDTACVQWKVLRGGSENCYRYYKVGANLYESWYEADGKTTLSKVYRIRE